MEIEADGIGHDLALGTATFQRSSVRAGDLTAGVDAGGPGADVTDGTDGSEGEDPDIHVDRETGELLDRDAEDPSSLSAA